MKITLKHPINISRLKKKISSQAKEQKENLLTDMNDIKFCDLSTDNNFSKQLGFSKELVSCNKRKYFKNKENEIPTAKIELGKEVSKQYITRIQSLEEQNKQIKEENVSLKEQLCEEERQKKRLDERICLFGEQLFKLKAEYEQELGGERLFSGKSGSQTNEKKAGIHGYSKVIEMKQRSIDLRIEADKPILENRRMSLQDSVNNLSSQVKDYKNELEIEKIRRMNLERQLDVYKQNIKLEAKRQIQILNKKVEVMKETIERKNQQISEKESFIHRIIKH